MNMLMIQAWKAEHPHLRVLRHKTRGNYIILTTMANQRTLMIPEDHLVEWVSSFHPVHSFFYKEDGFVAQYRETGTPAEGWEEL